MVFRVRSNQTMKFLGALILKEISKDRFTTNRLTLVYDHKKMPDGLGAQFQRILSLKALSDSIECRFESFSFENYDEAVFNNFEFEQKLHEIKKWTELINVSSSNRRPFSITIKTNPNKLFYLYIYRLIAKITFVRIRLVIAFPAILLDKNPWIYESFGKYLEQSTSIKNPSTKLQITVHIRRGEVLLSQFRDRYSPFEYYEQLLELLINELSIFGIQYSLTVLSEKISNPILESNNPKVVKSLEINPSNPYLKELENGKFQLLDEVFDAEKYPNLAQGQFLRNNDAFSDFRLMCNSDILLTSKSSFSFTAGLLNARALKIYEKFWHTPSGHWYTDITFKYQPREILSYWLTQNKFYETR